VYVDQKLLPDLDSKSLSIITSMTSNPQSQQINVTDLDVSQLAEVRKQLEEVCCVQLVEDLG